jgi:predicted amidohydrolase
MKVACYQCECGPSDFERNLATVLQGLSEADEQSVDIVAFPESLLTGYFTDPGKAHASSFETGGPEVAHMLERTARFDATFMVGYNERRGQALYNTVLIARGGRLLGTYSKAFPCFDYFTPGRDFPVFEHEGAPFGVILCADGAYIEPARILALKGAQIIFAPHYNFLKSEWVVVHFNMVRSDHIARAVENGVWFLRANTIGGTYDAGMGHEGVGYGDSYLLDPMGQIAAHAGWHTPGLMTGRVTFDRPYHRNPAQDSRQSARELGTLMMDAARKDHEA